MLERRTSAKPLIFGGAAVIKITRDTAQNPAAWVKKQPT